MTTLAAKDSTGNTIPVRSRSSGELLMVDSTGTQGVLTVNSTTAQTGTWRCITIINDAIFTSITETGATGSLAGLTLPAGLTLFGQFTAFTLASGAVRAYAQ